jgi:hypothetical protein
MHYLAVCAIYRDEGPYLREWVEFHKLVGVEKFFLYDNGSTDDHREQLAPYLADGSVDVQPWPEQPGQITAYAHCLETRRDDARWIAFIDLDEFLFSPTLAPVSEILTEYEEFPAVVANWALFGSSGHASPPPGLVIENYVWRIPDDRRRNHLVKSIANPRRTLHSAGLNPHCFIYSDGYAVNEQRVPVDRKPLAETDEVSFARLRVNHYYIKSEEQWTAKREAPMANSGRSRGQPPEVAEKYSVRDETITAYVPALREALAATAASRRAS